MIEELWLDDLLVMSPTVSLPNYHVAAFTGIGTPPPRTNRPVRGRRQGSFELTTFYDPRVFTMKIWVFGINGNTWDWIDFWDAYEALKESVSLASLTRTIKFKRKGNPFGGLEEAYVTPEEDIEPRFPHGGTPAAEVDITLVAADPRLYMA